MYSPSAEISLSPIHCFLSRGTRFSKEKVFETSYLVLRQGRNSDEAALVTNTFDIRTTTRSKTAHYEICRSNSRHTNVDFHWKVCHRLALGYCK